MTTFETLRLLRPHVSDRVLAEAFGMTRQNLHAKLGPRPPEPRPAPAPARAAPGDLPAVLKAWRSRHKLSEVKAADVLGLAQQTIKQWEDGSRACSLPTVLLLALHLIDEKTKQAQSGRLKVTG